jgi:hypothetical protein
MIINRDSEAVIKLTATSSINTGISMPKYVENGNRVNISTLSVRDIHWSGTWVINSIAANTTAIAGNSSIAIGGSVVTGVGSAFDTALANSDIIKIGYEVLTINVVTNSTSFTTTTNAVANHSAEKIYKCVSTADFALSGSGSWLLDGSSVPFSGTDGLTFTLTGAGTIITKIGKS